jgi:hypothetical protein
MRHLLFFLLLIFVFCKNEISENQALTIQFPTALRDTFGENGREILSLKAGEKVADLGAVSDFESIVALGGETRQTPWLRVKTTSGKTGWIFGGAVAPPDSNWLINKRLRCYFGSALAARIGRFAAIESPDTEADFAAQYREAIALRDTCIFLLVTRAERSGADQHPDFAWLPATFPGFIFQKVAEGTQPYLFADFHFWEQKALKTNGLQDDAFVQTCFVAFSADSIESFYPAWKFQISDYEAASQLGTGVHLKMFRQIESALKAGSLFQPELMKFKEALLEDILDNKTGYWQPKDLILKELNQILNADFACLNDRDRVALRAQLAMFANPAANDVRVNLRSGM